MVSHDFGGDIDVRVVAARLFDRQGQPITNELYVDKGRDVIEMASEGVLIPQRVGVAKENVRGQGSRAEFVHFSLPVVTEGLGKQLVALQELPNWRGEYTHRQRETPMT